MPETCPKCGATINDETVNCPDCQAPVKILRLEARVKMLEGAIEGWRSGAQRRDEEIRILRDILSKCADTVGAAVSPQCSIEFLSEIPEEIRLVLEKEKPSNSMIEDEPLNRKTMVNPNCMEIPEEVIGMFTRTIAETYNAVPIGVSNNRLIVAMADINDFHAITDINFMFRSRIIEHPSDPEQIKKAIERYYPVYEQKDQEPEEPIDTLDDEAIVEHAKKNAQAFKEQIERVFGEE